jgi:integral membrane protein
MDMKTFRLLALAEGISLLVLFLVAMPLKYALGKPLAVEIVGMIHGLLFIGYSLFLFYLGLRNSWSFKVMSISFISAFIPAGTFYADKKYFKPLSEKH